MRLSDAGSQFGLCLPTAVAARLSTVRSASKGGAGAKAGKAGAKAGKAGKAKGELAPLPPKAKAKGIVQALAAAQAAGSEVRWAPVPPSGGRPHVLGGAVIGGTEEDDTEGRARLHPAALQWLLGGFTGGGLAMCYH